MRISVLGCGRWGSFIAWYLSRRGNQVTSWGPEADYSYQILPILSVCSKYVILIVLHTQKSNTRQQACA